MNHYQNGIALIQVLLICAILTVFVLYLSQTARQQVVMATWSQERTEAEVAIHSAEAELLFALLTETLYTLPNQAKESSVANNWNFHGQLFELNTNIGLKIQDQASLINLHFLHRNRFNALLVKNGIDQNRAFRISDLLLDWQDADSISRANGGEQFSEEKRPRNGRIPNVTEIEHFFPLNEHERKLMYSNTGIYFVGDFNPMNASGELIAALSNPQAARHIVEQRNAGELTIRRFREISGIEEADDIRLYPSNTLSLVFVAGYSNANISRELVVALSPYANNGLSPYNVLLDRN